MWVRSLAAMIGTKKLRASDKGHKQVSGFKQKSKTGLSMTSVRGLVFSKKLKQIKYDVK